VTDGAASHPGSRRYPPEALRDLREQEARTAMRHLGLPPGRLRFLRFPDGDAPLQGCGFETAVDAICAIHAEAGSGAVLATWRCDPHRDHQAVARMAAVAAGRLGVPHHAYPVWGWTLPPECALDLDGVSGWRVRIADRLDAKRAAIAAHRSQTTDLIADATTPWHLPADMRAVFDRPYEVLIAQPRDAGRPSVHLSSALPLARP
ncbi:MAG: PIG-L family deacetylase, partial [Acetobacteraceae bacterium]|nr:PIG-L family deacetylase [Acetobacteraceae bacterium]